MKLVNIPCSCGRWFERQDLYDTHLGECAMQLQYEAAESRELVQAQLGGHDGSPESAGW
jgi:hypothetical protein